MNKDTDNTHTSEHWLAEVTQDGLALKQVPWDMRTYELCLAAVTQNGLALRDVPRDLCELELCRVAITNDASVNASIPHDHRAALGLGPAVVRGAGTASRL